MENYCLVWKNLDQDIRGVASPGVRLFLWDNQVALGRDWKNEKRVPKWMVDFRNAPLEGKILVWEWLSPDVRKIFFSKEANELFTRHLSSEDPLKAFQSLEQPTLLAVADERKHVEVYSNRVHWASLVVRDSFVPTPQIVTVASPNQRELAQIFRNLPAEAQQEIQASEIAESLRTLAGKSLGL